jgi:hypothetical protein
MSAGSHIPYTAPAEFDRNSAQNEKSAVIHAFIALRKARQQPSLFYLFIYTHRHKKRLIMISLINNLEIIFVLIFFIIVKLGYFQRSGVLWPPWQPNCFV